jgi:hypothetical protein
MEILSLRYQSILSRDIPKNEITDALIQEITMAFKESVTKDELNTVYLKYKKYSQFEWFIKIVKDKQNELSTGSN